DCLQIEFEPQPWRVGKREFTVVNRVPASHQFAAPRSVAIAERFLDHKIGCAHVKMQTCGKCHRPDRTMWCDAKTLRGRHRGDLLRGQNPTAVRDVHLNYVRGSQCCQAIKVCLCIESLSRGDRGNDSAFDLGK